MYGLPGTRRARGEPVHAQLGGAGHQLVVLQRTLGKIHSG